MSENILQLLQKEAQACYMECEELTARMRRVLENVERLRRRAALVTQTLESLSQVIPIAAEMMHENCPGKCEPPY